MWYTLYDFMNFQTYTYIRISFLVTFIRLYDYRNENNKSRIQEVPWSRLGEEYESSTNQSRTQHTLLWSDQKKRGIKGIRLKPNQSNPTYTNLERKRTRTNVVKLEVLTYTSIRTMHPRASFALIFWNSNPKPGHSSYPTKSYEHQVLTAHHPTFTSKLGHNPNSIAIMPKTFVPENLEETKRLPFSILYLLGFVCEV